METPLSIPLATRTNMRALLIVSLWLVSGTAHAYLSPQEVFTDLQVPEPVEAEVTEQRNTAAEPTEETTGQPSRQWKAEEKQIPAPTKAPAFFRAGNEIKKQVVEEEAEQEPEPVESPFDALEQSPGVADNGSNVEEVVPEVEEEAVVEEEPATEEEPEPQATKPAARSTMDSIFTIMGYLKYLAGGIALLFVAFAYFYKKKKPAVAAVATDQQPEASTEAKIPAPESSAPEESSPRLEKALEAMDETEPPVEGQ